MDKLQPTTTDGKVAAVLEDLQRERPIFHEILTSNADTPLLRYAEAFKSDEVEPIQPRDDFIEVSVAHARRLLGDETAAKLETRLKESPTITTGNHMEMEMFPLTMQTMLVASLAEKSGGVVPIFAGGMVPGRNATYPLGISLVREVERTAKGTDKRTVPLRYPVLPSKKYADSVVVAMPAFDRTMVQTTLDKVRGEYHGSKVTTYREMTAIKRVLEGVYMDDRVLAQSTYADQITIGNSILWKMFFQEDAAENAPELVYLQLETITDELLQKDVLDESTLTHQVLFNADVRSRLLNKLDTVPGCWDFESPYKGSSFFWGINEKAQSVTLSLEETDNGPMLIGKNMQFPFTPDGIQKGLAEGKLQPNIFMTFTTLAFARGLKCYGGFMQTEYATKMRAGLAESLFEVGNEDWAAKVAAVSTENYVTGITPVVIKYADNTVRTAGGIEIIAAGGLSMDHMTTIGSLSLQEANSLALPSIYSIVHAGRGKDPVLESLTSGEIYSGTKPKLVVLEYFDIFDARSYNSKYGN